MAFILGVLPLALATGAGAESRNTIGVTVFRRDDRVFNYIYLHCSGFICIVHAFFIWKKRISVPAGSS